MSPILRRRLTRLTCFNEAEAPAPRMHADLSLAVSRPLRFNEAEARAPRMPTDRR